MAKKDWQVLVSIEGPPGYEPGALPLRQLALLMVGGRGLDGGVSLAMIYKVWDKL